MTEKTPTQSDGAILFGSKKLLPLQSNYESIYLPTKQVVYSLRPPTLVPANPAIHFITITI